MSVYEPLYIFIFLLIVGSVYFFVLIHTIVKFKFNWVGLLFLLMSVGSYLLIGKYMFDSGIQADENHLMLFGLGFLELILLSFSYIFLVISILLGKSGERIL
ncbi:hypothetical protein V7122_22795 [Bacillus sp. JJ1532]|uniref:hypothetical protein n=1 Tax=Bacillus sp. JJ1532 TaxID=3122958 RepID=UPI002FFDA5BA